MEKERLELEPMPIWDACVTTDCLTRYTSAGSSSHVLSANGRAPGLCRGPMEAQQDAESRPSSLDRGTKPTGNGILSSSEGIESVSGAGLSEESQGRSSVGLQVALGRSVISTEQQLCQESSLENSQPLCFREGT